ncbi:MAG: hypothetical protein ACLS4Z_08185 [Christensenellaceae bacterium]
MRKKWLVLILLVLSILFLLIGCVAWGNTNANLDKLNSLQFTDCAEGNNLSYITESGIEINLYFGEHSVKAENSYLLSDRKDRLEVLYPFCGKAKDIGYAKTADIWASLPSLLQTAIEPENTRSADLDYCGDTRFAVWFSSKILAVLGF